MSAVTASFAAGVSPVGRLEVLFDEVAELVGQRNAIDGRLVEIVAELDRDELCGATGARSIAALVAWKTEAPQVLFLVGYEGRGRLARGV
ncbi:DUF222 domain-containing protein [Mycolicibacterium fortuitum]|nr:DUF222 domain-containing protein [Mycolicibacterium fortuitum]